ncbi:MAG TPA: hypothetical protein VE988_04225 [Gemmataceae bacterium]|nr:hypothetical protein [Gemmataceae bacterium]
MTTIIVPPDLETPLAEQARRQGITPEALVLDMLRGQLVETPAGKPVSSGRSLLDLLGDNIGTIEGTGESLSENCGQRFTEGLVEKRKQGRL